MGKTVFERIIARELPATIVYEDDLVVAFKDIHPAAPIHVLIVPRKPIAGLNGVLPEDESILGKLLLKAPVVAAKLGIAQSGYRIVINSGPDAGEAVPTCTCTCWVDANWAGPRGELIDGSFLSSGNHANSTCGRPTWELKAASGLTCPSLRAAPYPAAQCRL